MLFVGVISGTSVDGLDVALLDDSKGLAVPAGAHQQIPEDLRKELIALATPGDNEVERLGRSNVYLGAWTGQCVLEFLDANGFSNSDVRAIGSHGQTIRHHPEPPHPFSLQIGDASVIAEITGIDVVSDPRSRDLAAGGQGAPLVPVYHLAQFLTDDTVRVVVNIGGIGNITVLDGVNRSVAAGFDTGPGNALLDAWAQHHLGRPFDDDGAWAQSGQPSSELLERLLADPYYSTAPPKSTGKEVFNLAYIQEALATCPAIEANDAQATFCELSARTIADAISRWGTGEADLEDVVVCGGGRHNLELMRRLSDRLSHVSVVPSEEIGVNGDFVEAAALAYLAKLFVEHRPGNCWEATGASGPRVLGCLYPGA